MTRLLRPVRGEPACLIHWPFPAGWGDSVASKAVAAGLASKCVADPIGEAAMNSPSKAG